MEFEKSPSPSTAADAGSEDSPVKIQNVSHQVNDIEDQKLNCISPMQLSIDKSPNLCQNVNPVNYNICCDDDKPSTSSAAVCRGDPASSSHPVLHRYYRNLTMEFDQVPSSNVAAIIGDNNDEPTASTAVSVSGNNNDKQSPRDVDISEGVPATTNYLTMKVVKANSPSAATVNGDCPIVTHCVPPQEISLSNINEELDKNRHWYEDSSEISESQEESESPISDDDYDLCAAALILVACSMLKENKKKSIRRRPKSGFKKF